MVLITAGARTNGLGLAVKDGIDLYSLKYSSEIYEEEKSFALLNWKLTRRDVDLGLLSKVWPNSNSIDLLMNTALSDGCPVDAQCAVYKSGSMAWKILIGDRYYAYYRGRIYQERKGKKRAKAGY